MKTVFLTEEEFEKKDEIARLLFEDENDPRSSTYVRRLNRPPVNRLRIFFNISIIFFLPIVLFVLLRKLSDLSVGKAVAISMFILVSYVLVMLKRTVIGIVRIYQRYAPDSLRNKCRFEPSCSEYMILAIEKYGLLKGVRKGICRLKRCNINHGGFDFP